MDNKRRLLLAFVLMMIVAVAPSIIWPTKKPTPAQLAVDSAARRDSVARATRDTATPTAPGVSPSAHPPIRSSADTGRIVWVTSPLYRLGFSTHGGRLESAELLQYKSFAPADSAQPVQLVPPGDAFLRHRLVLPGGDTVSLADWSFQPSPDGPGVVVYAGQGPQRLRFDAERSGGGAHVTLEYVFVPDQYHFEVRGTVSGLGGGAVLLIDLADGLRSAERDSLDDYRHYSIVTKASKPERTDFGKIKPGERALFDGPFEWVGVKSKYFFLSALALEEGQPTFAGAIAVGGARNGRAASRANVVVTMPVTAGTFRYQVYAGPLDNRQLAPLGHGLDDANPYGGIFRPIIQPVSVFVVNILLWMHERLHLAYGWVLILFGIVIRVLLWPLNQKAMESSIRMQAVAPLLKEVQDKYKDDPPRLQREMMRLYKEHKVNPFGGCLPMLLPWPVLLALFFVFANTIVFRGVPFLWIPDLSRADPYKILPLILGLSMFALSKVGQIGVPPNPQTKMMVYFMPIMMTLLFLNFASGLNLYYASQNIFSIPQQYMIAMKRLRQAPVAGVRAPPPKT